MNEVFMLLNVKTNDPRPYKAQGLAEVDTKQVIAKRELIITDAPYPLASFRDTKPRLPRDMTRQEASEFLFKNGRLVCRCVYIVVLSNNGKSYEGEVRCVYKSECDRLPDQDVISKTGAQDPPQKSGHHLHSHDDVVELDPATAQKKPRPPHKSRMYTFGDCFCGAGIASQGAVHAGLKVVWGLEKFSVPMQAFRENHPNAIDLELDAEDFKEFVNRKNFAVDILHFSCPCQFWSEAQ
jgi:DNA (cytosine-5)-methyltransferase 1